MADLSALQTGTSARSKRHRTFRPVKAVINQIEVDKIGSATSLLGLARSLSIVPKNGTPRAGDVVVARVLTDNATYNMLELPTGRLDRKSTRLNSSHITI